MPDAQAPRLVLGDPAAPVTITEYGDLECPYCRDAEPVLRRLVEESGGGARLGLGPAAVAGEGAQRFADLVEADYVDGLGLGVRGTPTLLVQGERYRGPVELAVLREAVAAAVPTR